jgi:hypothetical protein
MQIICTTTAGAAHVLHDLLAAGLQPLRDFEIHPILSTTPPITYTFSSPLSDELARQIRAIANTSVI